MHNAFFHSNAHFMSWRLLSYHVMVKNHLINCKSPGLRGGPSHVENTSCVKKINSIGAIGS